MIADRRRNKGCCPGRVHLSQSDSHLGFTGHRKLDQRHVGLRSDSLLDQLDGFPIGILFVELVLRDKTGEVAETGEEEDVVLHTVGAQVCGEHCRSGFWDSDRFVFHGGCGASLLGGSSGFGRFGHVGNQGLLRSRCVTFAAVNL